MLRLIDTIQARLGCVDPALVSPTQFSRARQAGITWASELPAHLIQKILTLSRQNPPLGAAAALAVRAALSQKNPPIGQIVLAIPLVYWGYHAEAYQFLDTLPDSRDNNLIVLYARWHHILCARRLNLIADTSDLLDEIADHLAAGGDMISAMRCRINRISASFMQGNYEESENALLEIGAWFADQRLAVEEGYALAAAAYMVLWQGQTTAGFELIGRAESLFDQSDAPSMVGYTWLLRGIAENGRRELDHAVAWLTKSYDRAEAMQHAYYKVLAAKDLAGVLHNKGEVQSSLAFQREIEQQAGILKLHSIAASSAMYAAHAAAEAGRYDEAAGAYRQAREYYMEAGTRPDAAICSLNLGMLAAQNGSFGEALRLLNEARIELEAARAIDPLLALYEWLGNTYAAFGYLEPAVAYLEKCIQVGAHHDSLSRLVRPTIQLARLNIEQGHLAGVRSLLDDADTRASVSGMAFDAALIKRVRGLLLLKEGQPEQALAALQDSRLAFEMLRQEEAVRETVLLLAETWLVSGDAAQSRQILATLNKDDLPLIFRWRYEFLLGRLASTEGRLTEAFISYESTMRSIHAARASLETENEVGQFILSQRQVYDEAFAIARALNEPERALGTAEWQGSQLLSMWLEHSGDIYAGWDGLLANLRERLSSRLGQTWTILRYAWYESALWCFTITPEILDMQPVGLDHAAQIALRVSTSPDDSFRQYAYLSDAGRIHRQTLFDVLIPPHVQRRLEDSHTLVVIPSQHLHGLPFQALLKDGHALVEMTDLLYAQSLGMLSRLLTRSVAPQRSGSGLGLLASQSHFDQHEYPDLPHTDREGKNILAHTSHAEYLSAVSADLTAINQAGKTGVLAKYDWLHFATHAFYDDSTGAFTGLILGNSIVSIEDIRQWRLRARLVTLSACQTGLGRWYYGDEIAGLVQAFVSAGADSVAASSWLVADASTAGLMVCFYRWLSLLKGPAAALSAAQREAAESGLASYYWAPFTLFGLP
jgi:CHAT domain-containing protein/predicted negative regulator of RcsB-dependent stress response